MTQLEQHTPEKMGHMAWENDHVVSEFLRDEAGFLGRATPQELARLVTYFRARAFEALTPQEHEFFVERGQQIALYA